MEGKFQLIHYPIFALDWGIHHGTKQSILLIAGGGGSAKTGIQNSVNIFQMDETKTIQDCFVSRIQHDTENELVSNAALAHQHDLVGWGIGRKTFLYRIDENCKELTLVLEFETDFAEQYSCQNELQFSHKDEFLATGGEDGIVRIWTLPSVCFQDAPTKVDSLKPTLELKYHEDYINCISWNSSDELVVTSAKDGNCAIWEISTGTLYCKLPEAKRTIPNLDSKSRMKYIYRGCSFGNDPHLLFTIQTPTRGTSYLTKWNITKKQSVLVQILSLGKVSACTIKTASPYIGIGGSDGSITMYHMEQLQCLRRVQGHHLPVTGLAFRPRNTDTLQLISGSADYSLFLLSGEGRPGFFWFYLIGGILVLVAILFQVAAPV